ncbi:cobalt transport protein CbiN1 [Methanobrevibacter ruminantium M1]|uniref:Cobalt transport protein CbiN1 n=1 Tax=Methanobrevibacter ruminantium (strain ATCC 35063 / DSM 1093 / JCM 13430 / OCM 146 / M1) TaxID=634498 RepID=D3E1A8_METRM|nr:PDGLE domain-containing protein [Methanobrevibacter ruminantium]ADC46391.1 cobalt transport protein CbiN1 [Methanobrevibacter ruminantium M1]
MELSKSDKYLIVVGIIFCLALAVLSPYIASGDPDGLEKSAEDANVGEDVEAPVMEAPFPDYTYEPLEKIGEIGVLILGALITLIVAWGIGYALKRSE